MAVLQYLMMGRAAAGRTLFTGQRWVALENNHGEAGIGSTSDASLQQLGSLTTWQNTEPGNQQSDNRLVVNSEGKLYAWGRNNSGVLGLGDTTQRTSPVQVGTDTDWLEAGCTSGGGMAIKTNNTLWTWGENSSGALGNGGTTNTSSPAQVGSDTDWAHVLPTAANTDSLMAMKSDGGIYYSGLGFHGLSTVSSWTQIGSADGFVDAVFIGKGLVAWK
jgi:hypothetical protein